MVASEFIRGHRLPRPTPTVPIHEYSTVDTHTAGMPTRIVVDGLDHATDGMVEDDSRSVCARRDAFAANNDDVRRFLVCEPRGHDDMFAAVPVEPADPDADLGLFFMDADGYLDMCGHATIGAITALVETERVEPAATIDVETPAGLVRTRPRVEDGLVPEVTFENVRSAVCGARTVDAGRHGPIDVDIVSAGNICAVIDAAAVGIDLSATPASTIADAGTRLRDRVNDEGPVTDPISGCERQVRIVEFVETGPPHRTAVVFGDGAVDRSPCGTGTSARMTLLAHRGDLAVEAPFAHTGPTGESFTGRVLDATDGVYRTAVTGAAHVTGHHTFVRGANDPLHAFSLE